MGRVVGFWAKIWRLGPSDTQNPILLRRILQNRTTYAGPSFSQTVTGIVAGIFFIYIAMGCVLEQGQRSPCKYLGVLVFEVGRR